MEKTLLKVLTNQWIFETDLTLEETKEAVLQSKNTGMLLALPLNGVAAYINVDWENKPVTNNKTTFLDLNEIVVVGYANNTYVAMEEEKKD